MNVDTRTPEEKARAVKDAISIAELAIQVGELKEQLENSERRFNALCDMYMNLKQQLRQYSQQQSIAGA